MFFSCSFFYFPLIFFLLFLLFSSDQYFHKADPARLFFCSLLAASCKDDELTLRLCSFVLFLISTSENDKLCSFFDAER